MQIRDLRQLIRGIGQHHCRQRQQEASQQAEPGPQRPGQRGHHRQQDAQQIDPHQHPPQEKAVPLVPGGGDHGKIRSEPAGVMGKEQGVERDQKTGEQIQQTRPPVRPQPLSHPFPPTSSSSPASLKRTARISLPVFLRMSSSRMLSVMVDTRV